MYSDAELEAAVQAGVMPPATAGAFRDFVAARHGTPGADEEHFRLLSGFNDVFVTIAAVLILVALGWLGHQVAPALGAALVAAASWGMAEYFTRRRRMALPSIVLLLGFVGGVFATLFGLVEGQLVAAANAERALAASVCMIGAGAAAYVHWRRFMVPITVAAGAATAAGAVVLLIAGVFPGISPILLRMAAFLGGLGIFALAMSWDASDRQRTTRRADVAFWLHLAAAPLIVHPIFGMLGLLGHGTPAVANAAIAVLLYLVLAGVALAVDRRALLVSALFYVLYAIASLLRGAGSVSYALALAALVIGCGLLLLSALWQRARLETVQMLPVGLRAQLPPV